ncbi:hypothetical protein GCM10010191_62300 [Actinomadura vinacea]|uniref:Peptidoglycan binding-like domain-containing protein n=1 Tax=Actinomadura vinacea TaxID=115336 RepID=A0ABN3JV77_9ACTN
MKIRRVTTTGLAAAGIVTASTAVALPTSADTQAYYEGYGPHTVRKEGAKGKEVLALQLMLNCSGYRIPGNPQLNGNFGSNTAKQVVKYQTNQVAGHAEHAAKADGKVGAVTWHSLYIDNASKIRYGQTNNCVKAVQVLLSKRYAQQTTGAFGKETKNNVMSFQKKTSGLKSTGTVDAKTFHKLVVAKATRR